MFSLMQNHSQCHNYLGVEPLPKILFESPNSVPFFFYLLNIRAVGLGLLHLTVIHSYYWFENNTQ